MVSIGRTEGSSATLGIEKMPEKFVMLPAHARKRRVELEKAHYSSAGVRRDLPENRIEWGDKQRGFVASGVSYLYVKRRFPRHQCSKLGMAYPFPDRMINDFASQVKDLFIVEELDPFIERM